MPAFPLLCRTLFLPTPVLLPCWQWEVPPSHHYRNQLASQPVCFCFNWVTYWVDCDGQGLKDHRRLISNCWEKAIQTRWDEKGVGSCKEKYLLVQMDSLNISWWREGMGKREREKQDLIFGSGWVDEDCCPFDNGSDKIRGAWVWCLWILKTKKNILVE